MKPLPLVSFVLLAYNQEKYIREAVEGALAQTYSPLEIVLSDDCSKDRTYDIMKEIVATYQGPHKIMLNSNTKNLGIGGHINRVNEMAQGQLIVAAAGDDVSLATRVEKIVAKWLIAPERVHLIYSDCEQIFNDGTTLGLVKTFRSLNLVESFIRNDDIVLGAVCAWSRACFDRFGPLRDCIHHEDCIIPFRAALLGKTAHIPEPLVKYRVLCGSTVANLRQNISLTRIRYLKADLRSNIRSVERELQSTSDIISQKKSDLLKIGSNQEFVRILDARAKNVATQIYLLTGSSLIHKICLLAKRESGRSGVVKLLVKGEIRKFLKLRVEEERGF